MKELDVEMIYKVGGTSFIFYKLHDCVPPTPCNYDGCEEIGNLLAIAVAQHESNDAVCCVCEEHQDQFIEESINIPYIINH
jgi:hypothetical protein